MLYLVGGTIVLIAISLGIGRWWYGPGFWGPTNRMGNDSNVNFGIVAGLSRNPVGAAVASAALCSDNKKKCEEEKGHECHCKK